MSFDNISSAESALKLLELNNVGAWSIEIEAGQLPRMSGNAKMYSLLGVQDVRPSPEQVYRAWYDNINPTYRKLVDESLARMIDGFHAEAAYPWIHPVLGKTWVRCTGLRDTTFTKGVRLVGLHRDISELVQFRVASYRSEGGLRTSDLQTYRPAAVSSEWMTEETVWLWRTIVDTLPSFLFFKDVDNGLRYCYSNAQHLDFLGKDPTGKTDIENFGEPTGSKWHDEDVRMLESGVPFCDNDIYYNFSEGDRFYNVRKYPLVTQSGHRYVIGIGTDITDLYLEQIRVKCFSAVLEALTSASSEQEYVLMTFEAILRTVSWIPCLFFSAHRNLNRSFCLRSDSEGHILDAASGFDLATSESWKAYLTSLMPGEQRLCIDASTIEPSCRTVGLRACLSFPVMIEGCVLGYVSVFTNWRGSLEAYAESLIRLISDVLVYACRRWEVRQVIDDLERQKSESQASRLAEAEASAHAKSLFLASMSHEIRTPLNAIIGLSQELQNDDIPEQERQTHLRSINTASHALLDLINDVLDISKIESGHFVLSPSDTGLAELTRSCEAIFSDAATRRGSRLRWRRRPTRSSSRLMRIACARF